MRSILILVLVHYSVVMFSQQSVGIYCSYNYGEYANDPDRVFPEKGLDHNISKVNFGLIFQRDINEKYSLVGQVGFENYHLISNNFKFGGQIEDDLYDLHIKGKGINIQFGGRYSFLSSKRIELGVTVLPKLGILTSKEIRLIEDTSLGITDFHIDRGITLGIELNGILGIKVNEITMIFVRPGIRQFSYFDSNQYSSRRWTLDIGSTFSI